MSCIRYMRPGRAVGRRASVALAIALAWTTAARAAPEEIEVYRGDLNPPGGFTLETNNNYVASGDVQPEAPGEQPSLYRYRLTPELSYGLSSDWEIGALVVATAEGGGLEAYGVKARIRYIAPHGRTGLYWGGNLEIGATDRRLQPYPWDAELRGIFGYQGRRWVVAFNPTLEGSLSSPGHEPANFELQSKFGYRVRDDLTLGVESYNSFGPIRRFPPVSAEEQMLYFAADVALKRADINFGIGRGLTPASDGWVIKAVVSVPLNGTH